MLLRLVLFSLLFIYSCQSTKKPTPGDFSTEIMFQRTTEGIWNSDIDGIDTMVVLIDGELTKESNLYDPEFYVYNTKEGVKNHYYIDWYDSTNCFYPVSDTIDYSVLHSQEAKEILGYSCQKTTFTSETDTITVFVTNDSEVQYGYKPALDIKGCILEMSICNGSSRIKWTAINIDSNSKKEVEISDKFMNDASEEYKTIMANRKDDLSTPPVLLKIGDRAPRFSGVTLSGEAINLDKLKGKVVVLNFWFIACMGCIAEMPDLNKAVEHFDDQGVEFIALAGDSRNDLYRFLRKKRFDFKIIPNATMATYYYGVTGNPSTIIIDKEGKVAQSYYFQMVEPHIGYDNFINAIQTELDK